MQSGNSKILKLSLTNLNKEAVAALAPVLTSHNCNLDTIRLDHMSNDALAMVYRIISIIPGKIKIIALLSSTPTKWQRKFDKLNIHLQPTPTLSTKDSQIVQNAAIVQMIRDGEVKEIIKILEKKPDIILIDLVEGKTLTDLAVEANNTDLLKCLFMDHYKLSIKTNVFKIAKETENQTLFKLLSSA